MTGSVYAIQQTIQPKHLGSSDRIPTSHAASSRMNEVHKAISEVILDKDQTIRLLLAGVLANGHILVEDIPGVGKTTLAHASSIALGLNFNRVQFTSDLLPGDITGTTVFNRNNSAFEFHPGPVFSEMLLADEINRASPKTQSALLEAMEERKVTVDGQTRALPAPFLVIGSQNPGNHIGTNPLPESQLDRFLLSLRMGYPSANAEIAMLLGRNPRDKLTASLPVLQRGELVLLQQAASQVHVSEPTARYALKVVHMTRVHEQLQDGLSPRAAIGWINASKAWAIMQGRSHVLPDDLRVIFPHISAHRLRGTGAMRSHDIEGGLHKMGDWINSIQAE